MKSKIIITNAEQASCEQPENAAARSIEIEPVDAKQSNEEPQEVGHQDGLHGSGEVRAAPASFLLFTLWKTETLFAPKSYTSAEFLRTL